MSCPLMFDTLKHVKLLEAGGVALADVHTDALAIAMQQNIYTKPEVDAMLEKALQEFRDGVDKSIRESAEQLRKSEKESTERAHRLELEMARIANRTITTIVGILGSLIVAVGVMAAFAHSFLH